MKYRFIRVFAAGAVLVALGCSKDSTGVVVITPGNGTAVGLKGTLASPTLSGDIDITIAATASGGLAGITGCAYLKSATCKTVTGNYTVSTGVLSFGITSPALTFTGLFDNGVVEGSFSGSGGGVFSVRNGSATTYCGTFTGGASGTWNFTISGGSLSGVYDDGSGGDYLDGTVSGSTVSITFSGGTATGTVSGSSASGTWTSSPINGTWTGTNSGCRS